MDYRLNLGAWRKVFAVPSCVADEHHLKLASGTQIKVLLYMLAYPDVGHREDNIAAELGVCKEDVADALLYWENAQVLKCSEGELFPSETGSAAPNREVVTMPNQNTAAELSTPEARAALSSETHFPPKAIASAVNGDSAVKCLFETYEKLAGRPPKHAEQQTLMILVEEIGLPCEVTLMLIEYCFNIGKATPSYMKAVARDWIDSGIDTLSKAEERIRMLNDSYTAENRLHKKLGLSVAFSKKQKEMIAEWTSLGISDELIEEAYDIMITNTGKLSFPYMDKILRKWNTEGITSVSQLEKKKTESPDSPSYDTSEIEQLTLNKYKNLK